MEKIINALKANKEVYAYRVLKKETTSYQLFFVRQQLDINREVEVCEYEVTVFSKEEVDGKEMMGSSSFNIYPSMSKDEIIKKVDEQVKLCKFTLNKPYNLPDKTELNQVDKEKKFDNYSLKDAAFVVADALFEADKCNNGYINSSEIFINYTKTHLVDSNGNDFVYSSCIGEVEFITTWVEKDEEIELYKFIEFDHIDPDFIRESADKMLVEASYRAKAIKTPLINNVKMVLTGEYVKSFFGYFVERCSTSMVYSHYSDVKEGDNIQDPEANCDKITIRLEPTLKGSTKGMPFDAEGVALRKLNVIEKGKVSSLWGPLAPSQYLNKPVTGKLENIVASIGSCDETALENEEYLEIVSLSGFDIDPVTGDFGSEIRLAYYHKASKEVIPVTGGSLSGNVNDSIGKLRMSNKSKQENDFVGPSFVVLENVNLVKGE